MLPPHLRASSTALLLLDVRERDVPDLDILIAPFVEELRTADFRGDVLWEDWVSLGCLDLDFSVRHLRYTRIGRLLLLW